ncbi:retrovirus-related pol polyprotein from transposon TNT 1-94 [Tanacetum coccineum]
MKLPPSVSSADMFSGQIMVKCKRTRSTSSVMCKCKSGLAECKASTSNLRRIQVKDIVKEVEDYLKTYSSAEMDISSYVEGIRWGSKDNPIISGTIPPIPPPLGTNFGNTGNPNRVDTIPTTNDTNTTTTTTNVAQNGVDENLPQLLDTRGGSHVTNIHAFDKEDFTSWKVRFLVFLDGLEPYLLNTLEDGPFAVIKCKTAKAMWNDLILAHEGPSDTRDTKIAALRLKFDTFKALDDNDSDVEEDIRSSSEFISDLNTEYHERALLVNQKRFYKRSGRVGSSRKPIDKSKEICFTCGKPGHFQKDYPSNKTSTPSYPSSNKPKPYTPPFTQTFSQNTRNHQRDYKGKYKGLKVEMAVLTKRIDDLTKGKSEKGKSDKGLIDESFKEFVSSKDERTTKIKAFMAIAEDEPSVGKADARSGQ